MRALTLCVLLSLSSAASARPFRAMVTRTAETTNTTNLELGLRYQGFLAGSASDALPYQQVAPSLRFGLLPNLELNIEIDFLVLDLPGRANFNTLLGDVPIGVQYTFLENRNLAAGVFLRGTIPTSRPGAGIFDWIPPTLSDGTLDLEGTLILEFRPSTNGRVMINLGYLYHGVRERGGDPDFDVPDAIRGDIAATFNLGDQLLLGVELVTRYYLDPAITPRWQNNEFQVEAIPHLRLEVIPDLVLEAAVGIALTPDLQEIYRLRGLLGFTYELDFNRRRKHK